VQSSKKKRTFADGLPEFGTYAKRRQIKMENVKLPPLALKTSSIHLEIL